MKRLEAVPTPPSSVMVREGEGGPTHDFFPASRLSVKPVGPRRRWYMIAVSHRGLKLMRIVGVAAVLAFAAALSGCGAEPKVSTCRQDGEIDQTLREGAAEVSRAFFAGLLKGDGGIYEHFSTTTKAKIARDKFEAAARAVLGLGPYDGLKLEHLFQPQPLPGETRVACGTLGAMKEVSLAVIPEATQIHVLFTAATRNNDWALTARLTQEEGGAWRVYGFDVAMSSIVGFDAAELFAQAEAQAKKGHALNAHMLYTAAKATVSRGLHFDFALAKDIEAAHARLAVPDELKGKPPFTWVFDGVTFTLEQVNFAGIDKRLGLVFLHRDPVWDGEDTGKGERRNKRLIDAFVKAHPEYKETFGFLVARILAPGKDSGWGTVFDSAKGYDTGEPSVVKKRK